MPGAVRRVAGGELRRPAVDLERAEGSYLWTNGKRLIDFTSGWNTTNLGWNNVEVSEAIIAQVGKNTYTPMWTADAAQIEYAKLLTAALPAELTAVGRATGGTEANEMAIFRRASSRLRNQLVFRHSSRTQPLKLSICPFCMGLPG